MPPNKEKPRYKTNLTNRWRERHYRQVLLGKEFTLITQRETLGFSGFVKLYQLTKQLARYKATKS